MDIKVIQTVDAPVTLVDAGSSFYFLTDNNVLDVGEQFGKSDGTSGGTTVLNIESNNPLNGVGTFTTANGFFFFDGFGDTGEEPYRTDGTLGGTIPLADINPTPNEPSDPEFLFRTDETVYFIAEDGDGFSKLHVSDGTSEGTERIFTPDSKTLTFEDSSFASFKGNIYFAYANSGRFPLYRTNGTQDGTEIFKEFTPDFSNPIISEFSVVGEKLFFQRSNELWVTDGTSDNTELLIELNDIGAISGELNGQLFFAGARNSTGLELWTSNGTEQGTKPFLEIRPEERIGSSTRNVGSEPENFIEVGNQLFFTADNGVNGRELWVTDGTEPGTKLVLDITEGESNTRFTDFEEVNGTLYFITGSGSSAQLWQSKGTEESTIQIQPEINQDGLITEAFNQPTQLLELNDKLYFSASAYSQESGDYVPAILTLEDVEETATTQNNTVFRLRNINSGVHFYTTDVAERDGFIAQGYDNEGASHTAADPTDESAEEVYRFYNSRTNVHLYTTNETERENIQQNLPDFTFQGEVFKAYETEVAGSIPIYRFFEPNLGVHLYTPNEVERESIVANLPNYTFEGIAYYAFPLEANS